MMTDRISQSGKGVLAMTTTDSSTRVFLVHLALSGMAVTGLVAMVWQVWYPGPWLQVAGALEQVLILAGVLLVLGPVLTFVLWRRGARGNAFDLAALALVQVAALAYVVWALAWQRPAFVVFDDGHFVLATWPEVRDETLPAPLLERLPHSGPMVVWAEPLDGANEHLRVMTRGKPATHTPQRYRDLTAARPALAASGMPLRELVARDARVRRHVMDLLPPGSPVPESWRIYPVYGSRDGWSAVVDVDSGRIVHYVHAHSRWIRADGYRARSFAGAGAAAPARVLVTAGTARQP